MLKQQFDFDLKYMWAQSIQGFILLVWTSHTIRNHYISATNHTTWHLLRPSSLLPKCPPICLWCKSQLRCSSGGRKMITPGKVEVDLTLFCLHLVDLCQVVSSFSGYWEGRPSGTLATKAASDPVTWGRIDPRVPRGLSLDRFKSKSKIMKPLGQFRAFNPLYVHIN